MIILPVTFATNIHLIASMFEINARYVFRIVHLRRHDLLVGADGFNRSNS